MPQRDRTVDISARGAFDLAADGTPDMKPQTLVHARRLELAALALFVAVALVGLLASGWAHALLAAFSVTALAYAALVAAALQSCEESDLPTLAARHDQRAPLILCFGLLLDFASLALVVTLMATRTMDVYATALAGLSIASAWVLLNMLFAIHYAHVFFTSEQTQPLSFPGGRPPVFSDFVYFSFVVGMTFQVSDVAIVDSALRRLVLAHSLLAFLFNVFVVALAVNALGRVM
ncbi:MAG: DUF1345 domain-containing protein [Parvularculaceae bacterium]